MPRAIKKIDRYGERQPIIDRNMTLTKAKSLIKDKSRAICGSCGERLFAPFDILFMHEYSACIDCYQSEKSDDEVDSMSEPIFDIVNQL